MPTDPIIAEIHQIREQLWKQCHGSPEEMAQRQRKLHQPDKSRVVDPAKWKKRRAAVKLPARRDSMRRPDGLNEPASP